VYSVQILKIGEMPEVLSTDICIDKDPDARQLFCYTMLVARCKKRVVVVNAGFPDDITVPTKFWKDSDPNSNLCRTDEMRVETQLEKAGVNVKDVDILLLNPLGPYSTGKVDLFSHSEICFGRTAWVDFISPESNIQPSNPREVAIPKHVLHYLVCENWERVRLLEDEDQVCPGITVIRVGSHHKGSFAVFIETDSGTVVYTDAVFTYENLDRDVPAVFSKNIEEFHSVVQLVKEKRGYIFTGL